MILLETNDVFVKQVEEYTNTVMEKNDTKFGMYYAPGLQLDINNPDENIPELPVPWALKTILNFNNNTFFIGDIEGYPNNFSAYMFYPVLVLKDYKHPENTIPLYGLWVKLHFYVTSNRSEIERASISIARTHFTEREIITGFIHPYVNTRSYNLRRTCLGQSSLGIMIGGMSSNTIKEEEELEFFLWNCISYLSNEDQSAGPYTTMYNTLNTDPNTELKKQDTKYADINVQEYLSYRQGMHFTTLISLLQSSNISSTFQYLSSLDYICNSNNEFYLANTEKNQSLIKDLIFRFLNNENTLRPNLSAPYFIDFFKIDDGGVRLVYLRLNPLNSNSTENEYIRKIKSGAYKNIGIERLDLGANILDYKEKENNNPCSLNDDKIESIINFLSLCYINIDGKKNTHNRVPPEIQDAIPKIAIYKLNKMIPNEKAK